MQPLGSVKPLMPGVSASAEVGRLSPTHRLTTTFLRLVAHLLLQPVVLAHEGIQMP
jgi:hypothetical protein